MRQVRFQARTRLACGEQRQDVWPSAIRDTWLSAALGHPPIKKEAERDHGLKKGPPPLLLSRGHARASVAGFAVVVRRALFAVGVGDPRSEQARSRPSPSSAAASRFNPRGSSFLLLVMIHPPLSQHRIRRKGPDLWRFVAMSGLEGTRHSRLAKTTEGPRAAMSQAASGSEIRVTLEQRGGRVQI